ncbi:MAG TPA: asparagine synthase (glutamine-hydrolyzing) [Planctomycetota bacterium]|jgi:asparagine synthase (glutamine-hydrolysing)|nr:asparagine synthase (glutamine-hydrolyzing) [Planctomycetota bacterium]
MCGLAGAIALRGSPPPTEADVRAMAATIVHRGPDAEGFFVEGPAALGYRRLAILDLAGGDQPIFSEDGRAVVFQNGEIYNFRELRAELEGKGHSFRTAGDTEVIAHLYEESGDAFPERLRGMFAVAVYDRARRRLLLARDRLGKKPLYYADLPGLFLYGSELKALLALPAFPRAVDGTALLDFFTYRAVPSPKSIFAAARKLPPGHLLAVEPGGAGPPRPYWRLSFAEPFADPPERLAARLRELLVESVRLRLVSDVPLGAFLSGGIDSAAVVAAMVAADAGEVLTCAVGFDDPRHDEREGARETALALRTRHRESQVSLDPLLALDLLPRHFDEPFSDASAVPTYAVSRIAREAVTVALSGDGGDENFAGYRRYVYDRIEGRVRKALPAPLRPVVRALAAAYPKGDWMPRPLRAKTLLQNLAEEPLRAYFRSVRANDPAFLRSVLGGDLRERLRDYDPFGVLADAHARADAPDPLGRILQTDLATYLPDDILTKVDRASMAVSLEVRCPLLDQRLVEFAARVPTAWKLRRGRGKWILRRALEGLVPEGALRRRKHGFDVPLRSWTRGRLRGSIEEAIRGAPPGLYDRAALEAAWKGHLSGAKDRSELFFAVLFLERWRRAHAVPLP